MKNPNKRALTNDDVKKYEPMVEKYIRDSVIKNWNEAQLGKGNGDISLGNTGMSLEDIRQHLRAEVVVALQNYNPDYRTKDGKSTKESTFVFGHLYKRIGQMMKRLTKKRYGYGVWSSNLEEVLWETDRGVKPPSFDNFGGEITLDDLNGGVLTEQMIEDAAQQAMANCGAPDPTATIFMGGAMFNMTPQVIDFPWDNVWKLTKREGKFAALHKLLYKLKVCKSKENNDWTYEKATRRLKKAKWAKAQPQTFNPVIKPENV